MNFLHLLTLGTSTTATPGARDASPAGTASIRDALLTLVVTAACAYAAANGVPIPPEEAQRLILELGAGAASIVGVLQYVRRKIADKAAKPA